MAATLTGTPVAIVWGSGANPAGQSMTIPADCTAVYFFGEYYSDGAGTFASATLAGNAPSQTFEVPQNANGSCGWVAAWYNPPTGSQTLTVAFDDAPTEGPTSIVVFVKGGETSSWRDADGATNTSVAGTTTLSVTLTTVSGDLVLKFDSKFGGTVPPLSSGWTNAQTQTQGGHSARLSYISATGTSQVANAESEDYSVLVAISIPENAATTLTCDAGSYALTGQDVTLTHSAAPAALDAEPGSYALTGQAVGLSAARVLDCESGSYVLTGSDAAVDTAITASPGSYALTGQDVQLGAARVMSAAPGSYALTGQAVNLTTASILSAEPGAYALTGQPATLRATHPALSAQAGVYALTGQDVTLTHGAIGAFTLTAEPGAYTLSGQAAILGAAHRLAAAFGTYTYVGQDATFHVTRGLTCEFGSYVLTGQPVTLTANAGAIQPVIGLKARVRQVGRSATMTPVLKKATLQ